jgi:hypothetical protein
VTTKEAWLEFADKLVAIGFSILSEAQITETEKGAADPKVVAATLLIRTLSNFRGAMALAREGRVVEARVLARCCFENNFWIAELAARGDAFVREMGDDESKSRKARGEFILSEGFRLDEEVEKRLKAQLRTAKKRSPQARFLNPKDVARGGPLAQGYIFYSQLSSDAAHPTMASLNRYIGRFEKNGETVRGFDCDPPVKEAEIAQTVDWACLALIGACVGVSQILEGTPAGQGLVKVADEWQALRQE